MKILLLFIAIMASYSPCLFAEKKFNLVNDNDLVRYFQSNLVCKKYGIREGNLHCFLNFRGLSLEFAGINDKNSGTIYVDSLGLNQTLLSVGGRCILIEFKDKDLLINDPNNPHMPGIIFRDDSFIASNYSNGPERAKCFLPISNIGFDLRAAEVKDLESLETSIEKLKKISESLK